MSLPRIRSYGNYSSGNYGVNSLEVTIGQLTVYFSYQTPVAFDSLKTGLVCRQNDWGTTTGKHLNQIEQNKKARVPSAEFERRFQEVLESYGLNGN